MNNYLEHPLVVKACDFATTAHRGQFRKGKNREPVIAHAEEVARLIFEAEGTPEEIAAGFLHDTVEDCKVSIEEIRREFGDEVANIVKGLTDPPNFALRDLVERKQLQMERIQDLSISVKLAKIADQTSNLRSIAKDPPEHWSREKKIEYIQGARQVVNRCRRVSNYLSSKFDEAYNSALRSINSPPFHHW